MPGDRVVTNGRGNSDDDVGAINKMSCDDLPASDPNEEDRGNGRPDDSRKSEAAKVSEARGGIAVPPPRGGEHQRVESEPLVCSWPPPRVNYGAFDDDHYLRDDNAAPGDHHGLVVSGGRPGAAHAFSPWSHLQPQRSASHDARFPPQRDHHHHRDSSDPKHVSFTDDNRPDNENTMHHHRHFSDAPVVHQHRTSDPMLRFARGVRTSLDGQPHPDVDHHRHGKKKHRRRGRSKSDITHMLRAGAGRGRALNEIGETEPFLRDALPPLPPRMLVRDNEAITSQRKRRMRHHSVDLFMSDHKGVEQNRRFRDIFFALLFYAQFAVVVFLGVWYGPSSMRESDEEREEIKMYYLEMMAVACSCGLYAVVLSALTMFAMTVVYRRLIEMALIFSIGASLAWSVVGILFVPRTFVPVSGCLAFALCVGYALVVWYRIPFAAANLHSALSGVRATRGSMWAVGAFFQAVALVWSIWWTFAFIGVYDAMSRCHGGDGDGDSCHAQRVVIYVAFAISYFWTFQVITHMVQVITAGVIGTWWSQPDLVSSCCPKTARISLVDALMYSCGSVCFGSLFVALVQSLRQLVEQFRPKTDADTFMCLPQCPRLYDRFCVGGIDELARYFNPWAFTYIGMYKYGFLEAGKDATDLFFTRGWTDIVTDDLITNILLMVCLVIGGCTCCFGLVVEAVFRNKFHETKEEAEDSSALAFVIGLVIGFVLSNVVMSVVSGSVNTVIVCYAVSPATFQAKHRELSDEMTHAWMDVWPGCVI